MHLLGWFYLILGVPLATAAVVFVAVAVPTAVARGELIEWPYAIAFFAGSLGILFVAVRAWRRHRRDPAAASPMRWNPRFVPWGMLGGSIAGLALCFHMGFSMDRIDRQAVERLCSDFHRRLYRLPGPEAACRSHAPACLRHGKRNPAPLGWSDYLPDEPELRGAVLCLQEHLKSI